MSFLRFEWVMEPKEEVKEIVLFKGSSGKASKRLKDSEKSFIIDWEKELGYIGNPFQNIILTPADIFMAGFKDYKEKLNLFIINNHKFGRIIGNEGCGKSLLLRWLYEQIKGHEDKLIAALIEGKKVSDSNTLMRAIIEPLLSNYEKRVHKAGETIAFEKEFEILKAKSGRRRLVLLIDDFDAMPNSNIAMLNHLYNAIPLQVIVSQNKNIEPQKEIEDKDKLNIHIKGLLYEEAMEMIKKRIEHFRGRGIYPFNDTILKSIYKRSESNPKLFLEFCNKRAIELAVRFAGMSKPAENDESTPEEEPEKKGFLPEEPVKKTSEYKIKEVKQGSGEVIIHK